MSCQDKMSHLNEGDLKEKPTRGFNHLCGAARCSEYNVHNLPEQGELHSCYCCLKFSWIQWNYYSYGYYYQ